MGAREKIAGLFPGKPHLGLRVADEILNDHLREIAEFLRTSEDARNYTDGHMGDIEFAADLIDPGAEA